MHLEGVVDAKHEEVRQRGTVCGRLVAQRLAHLGVHENLHGLRHAQQR
jgi:hypothetical protein